MKKLTILLSLLILSGCGGVSVLRQPNSTVLKLSLNSITPETLFFQGQVALKNTNPVTMSLDFMHVKLTFNDQVNIIRIINNLPVLSGFEEKLLNFQLVVPRDDLATIKSNQLTMVCQGRIPIKEKYLHEPLVFNYTARLTLPPRPIVRVLKKMITKDKKHISIRLAIENKHTSSLKFHQVQGYIDWNQYTYDFLNSPHATVMPPQQITELSLLATLSNKRRASLVSRTTADLTFFTDGIKLITTLHE